MTHDAARGSRHLVANPKFAATASTPERIRGLLSIGLSHSHVAQAVGVSEATIKNWLQSATSPRDPAERALDDLRTAVLALEEAGIADDRAVKWLTSRNTGLWLHGRRPIEVLADDPLRVLATIEGLIEEAASATTTGVERAADRPEVHLHVVQPEGPAEKPPTRSRPPAPKRRRGRATA